MFFSDKHEAAKYGAYRVVIPTRRARHRAAVQRLIETFMDDRIKVADTYHKRAIEVYCTCKRQANILASHFNGEITYRLTICYRRYNQLARKCRAVEEILAQQGVNKPNMNNYHYIGVTEKVDTFERHDIFHYYLPCRRSVILAKLSIPDLTEF